MNKVYSFPKLHNATWPGIVGKGEGSEPIIPFDDILRFTANAQVDGIGFDGVDIGLLEPHIDISKGKDEAERIAEKVSKYGLKIGSMVAPIWAGSAMGSEESRKVFVDMVRQSCEFGGYLRDLGVRPYGVIRIDSSCSVEDWVKDPDFNSKQIVDTFRQACDIAADYGESLAAEGEICWGGMHSWKTMLDTLEAVDRPNMGFQADMSHTFLYLLGYNSPEHRILPDNFEWSDRAVLEEGLKKLTAALRPWTIDFHVAQNDGTAFGSGSHDKTGRHCLPNDPKGKLNIAKDAGYWLRDESGKLTKAFEHICWDGCMFPNKKLNVQETWNEILAALISVRNAHGWT
ncbi:MAG TPA: TIM barrel protein [Sphingobacterium sp.]|nr:TIM barrel protein [Sphingobacterium sp.]